MKTNYKEALLFIAYDTRVTHLEIDKDFEEDGKYSVRFHGGDIFDDEKCTKSYSLTFGYGDSIEEACEDYFQKIAGKILVFEKFSSKQYSVDDEIKKYRSWKERELKSNLNYENYLDLLIKNRRKPFTIASKISKITTKNIKGRTLYGINVEGLSVTCLLYDDCCSYIKRAQVGDTIQLAFADSDPSLKERVVVSCRVTLKERLEKRVY